MATIDSLGQKSISEMTEEELQEELRKIRRDRHLVKAPIKRVAKVENQQKPQKETLNVKSLSKETARQMLEALLKGG